ncbi:MAG: nickel transporter permease [Selenomonadaceae bacterium]
MGKHDDKFMFRVYSGIVIFIVLVAAIGPFLCTADPYNSNMANSLLAPSADHWFGTDKLGRDCFTRIIYGARVSLSMTIATVVIMSCVGTLIGIISGYCGGWIEMVLMRFTDMMMAFPGIVLAIAIAGVLGGSVVNTVLALAIVGWTKYARLGRSLTIKLKHSEFIAAAVTNGTKPFPLLYRHIVPNIFPLVVVTAAMDIGSMIMEIAGLSFLGFGAQPPTAEWGLMLNEGRQVLQTAPWAMIFPGLAILFVVATFNLWGDALRDIMDPSKSA